MEWEVRDIPSMEETDRLAKALNEAIGCPVRLFPYDKGFFECACGITFMPHLIKGERWDLIKEKHKEGR